MTRHAFVSMAFTLLGALSAGLGACTGDAAGRTDTAPAGDTASEVRADTAATSEIDDDDGGDGTGATTAPDAPEAHDSIPAETTPETLVETGDDTLAEVTTETTPTDTAVEIGDTTPIEARVPRAGDVWIAELQIDPSAVSDLHGEWVELENRSGALLDLVSCWLEVDAPDPLRHALAASGDALRLGIGRRLVVGRDTDPATNGGATVDLLLPGLSLPNASGTLRWGCGETVFDTVAWDTTRDPLVAGRALVRNGTAANPALCAARTRYGAVDERGTPGAPNDDCDTQLATSACALIAPTAATAGAGIDFPIVGRFVVPGETDFSPGNDRIPRFRAEVGWAPVGDALVWTDAEPFDAALDTAHADADTWGRVASDFTAGAWSFGFRVSFDGGAAWTTCTGLAVTLAENPCFPNPCAHPPDARCVGANAVDTDPIGICTRAGATFSCAYPEHATNCAELGGTCASGACEHVAPAPSQAGDLVINEIMSAPLYTSDTNGEWIELRNMTADALNLSGCTLSDAGDDLVIVSPTSPLVVAAGAYVVLGGSVDTQANGTVVERWAWGSHYHLDDSGDEIRLTCGITLIDEVAYALGFPLADGRAASLDPDFATADENDLATSWCSASASWTSQWWLDKGTPGAANAPCARAIDWCGLFTDPSIESLPGAGLEIAIQIREEGVTDRTGGTDVNSLVKVQVGIGDPHQQPSTWSASQFEVADADPFWGGSGDTDQYIAALTAPEVPADYTVAGRVTADGGVTWTYCDRATGFGGGGSSDGYATVDSLALVVVTPDACTPNPCAVAPVPTCDADETRHRLHDGACTIVPGVAGAADTFDCAYADDRTDCAGLGGVCAPEGCVGGAKAPAPGELVFTEIMAWPGVVADFFGEWVELESLANDALNLDGCELRDGGGGRFALSGDGHVLLADAGATIVFARAMDERDNGGVAPLAAWVGAFGLGNSADMIALYCNDSLVDAVAWDAGWGFTAGRSLQLDPGAFDASANDARPSWCPSDTPYGDGDLGTPGAENAECP